MWKFNMELIKAINFQEKENRSKQCFLLDVPQALLAGSFIHCFRHVMLGQENDNDRNKVRAWSLVRLTPLV